MKNGEVDEDRENRTVFCGNLSEKVTDEILYELFLQAGPVESVRRPNDQYGKPRTFGFVVYKHACSVPYALELLKAEKLFNRKLNLNSHSKLSHIPVLDTHLTDFNEPPLHQDAEYRREDHRNHRERQRDRERDRDRNSDRDRDRGRRSEGSSRHSGSRKERDPNEPKSWTEFNSLKGKDSLVNGYQRSDLQSSPYKRESMSNNGPPAMPDVNALLQMGSQMMMPGMMALGGMMPVMSPLGPPIGGGHMFPSMYGRHSGGERHSPDRERGRQSYHEARESRRSHPYNDRSPRDLRDDHHRHDRGYSSSRSSHDRERRDRRSR